MRQAAIRVHVISGQSAGAAVDLPAGQARIGHAEDCDIFLGDAAPFSLVVSTRTKVEPPAEEGGDAKELRIVEVSVLPGAGAQAALDGVHQDAERFPWPQGACLSFGLSAYVWQLPGEPAPAFTLVPLELARALLPEMAEAAPEAALGAEPAADAVGQTPTHEDAPVPAAAEKVGGWRGWEQKAAAWPMWQKAAAGAAAAVLAAGIFFALGEAAGASVAAIERQSRVDAFVEAMGKAPILNRNIDRRDGAWVVSGIVADDAARQKLAALASTLPSRVLLDVQVADDAWRAATATLNARGFYPAIASVPVPEGSAKAMPPKLSAYVKDGAAEAKFLAIVRSDLPQLAGAAFHFVYAGMLAPALRQALAAQGVPDKGLRFEDGHVALDWPRQAGQEARLAKALADAEKAVGAPVRLVRAEAEAPAQRRNAFMPTGKEFAQTPAEADDPVWGKLSVAGVAPGAFPFVTTQDGQKFFVGAKLPGGQTLKEIHADHLVLDDGGQSVTYALEDKK
jgi:type III secretion system YscD/HrpQ family protein